MKKTSNLDVDAFKKAFESPTRTIWFMIFSVEDLHRFFKLVENSIYGSHTEFSLSGFLSMEQMIASQGGIYCTFTKTSPLSGNEATPLPDYTVIRRGFTNAIEKLPTEAKIYSIADLIQEQ